LQNPHLNGDTCIALGTPKEAIQKSTHPANTKCVLN